MSNALQLDENSLPKENSKSREKKENLIPSP